MPSLAFVCRDVIAARLGAGLTPFYVGSMEAYRVIEQFLQALRFPQTMFRKPYQACHQGRMRPAVAPMAAPREGLPMCVSNCALERFNCQGAAKTSLRQGSSASSNSGNRRAPDEAEGASGWRRKQSRANPSPRTNRCYQGKIQGNQSNISDQGDPHTLLR